MNIREPQRGDEDRQVSEGVIARPSELQILKKPYVFKTLESEHGSEEGPYRGQSRE
jgi:hypothetical protein